ncbi:cytochrome b pre-mRNA-processing protein 3 [Rhizobium halophytocola]|uniref:Cytochrome b pre-mRNA-processing protein 3 n=1 Tax=Rhizobium halophytocola TaxID=735519 RepID=A0ABS4DYB1_9HYPH|nr:cytochrome b pre-mRNA-processing protein 3 [Rhizobium halophytocola]
MRKKKNNRLIVDRQYDLLTTVARAPSLYLALGVPDTVMGRFEALALVLILYFRRTRQSQQGGQEVAQEIVDAFFQDVDHSIRELGIGDQGVPKRMKKFAAMFYGRLESYAAALDARDRDRLAEALRRNIYPEAGDKAPDLEGLAAWMFTTDDDLTTRPEEEVISGRLAIKAPEEILR